MKSIYLLLLLAVSCYAQSNATASSFGLEKTFLDTIPLCSAGNATVNTTASGTASQICTHEEERLKCKTLADNLNSRELIALVEGKGIAFYQGFPQSGNATPVAFYPSDCQTLFVIGSLNDTVLISSAEGIKASASNATSGNVTSAAGCKALGIGAIPKSEIVSSAATPLTTVAAIPYTEPFSFMDSYVWDPNNSTLYVKGASGVPATNATSGNTTSGNATSTEKQDLILGLKSGDLSNPDVIFKGIFPFNLDLLRSQIFWKNGTAYLVGPAWNSTVAEERVANSVEIWGLKDPANAKLIDKWNITNVKFVGVNEVKPDALYIASSGSASPNVTSNNTSSDSDKITIVDITDLNNTKVMKELTFGDVITSAQEKGVNISSEASGVKNITAMNVTGDSLWVGWNTGDVLLYSTEKDIFDPELEGLINILKQNATGSAGPNTSTVPGVVGVTYLCPAKLREYRSWLTAKDPAKAGGLFGGVQLGAEVEGTS